jgi:succinate-acetate transporter protein
MTPHDFLTKWSHVMSGQGKALLDVEREDAVANLTGLALLGFAVVCFILCLENLRLNRRVRATAFAVLGLVVGLIGSGFATQKTMI